MISDNSSSIKINKTKLRLYSTTGIVADTSTRSETEVSGSGGGGIPNTHPGSSQSSPVHFEIESNTTRYQDIFLVDQEKCEHAFNLVDFLVPCRKGNLLTMVWGIKPKKEQGPYFAAINHDTKEISYDDEILDEYCRPRLLALVIYPVVTIIITAIILLLVSYGISAMKPPSIIAGVFMLIGFLVGVINGWRLAALILQKMSHKKIDEFKSSADWRSTIDGLVDVNKENFEPG